MFEPTASRPKLSAGGVTASCAGVKPMPAKAFVRLPALLAKKAALLKLAAFGGLKLINTKPVWLEATLKELPLWIVNGGMVVTLPVRTNPPLLITRNV